MNTRGTDNISTSLLKIFIVSVKMWFLSNMVVPRDSSSLSGEDSDEQLVRVKVLYIDHFNSIYRLSYSNIFKLFFAIELFAHGFET